MDVLAASFTADSLGKSALRNQEILTAASDTIRSVNSEIMAAKEAGALYLDTTIANIFTVSHMKPDDARREIFYIILSNFIGRRFRVMLKENETNARLLIAWFGKQDLERIKKQNELISYCKKPFEKRTVAETKNVINSMKSIKQISYVKDNGKKKKDDSESDEEEEDEEEDDEDE